MYLFPGDGRESCHVAKGSTDYLRQGMKDSAVCHAVVAFPDVMAGDNDENSIFESKRAKCEIGSGKFFSLSCQKSTKPFLDMCRKKLHSNATMTTDSLLSLSPSHFLSLKHFSHSGYLRLFFFHSIIILTTLSQPGKGKKRRKRRQVPDRTRASMASTIDVASLNITFCPAPFLKDSDFPDTGGCK